MVSTKHFASQGEQVAGQCEQWVTDEDKTNATIAAGSGSHMTDKNLQPNNPEHAPDKQQEEHKLRFYQSSSQKTYLASCSQTSSQ